jgi:hypothetical protein
MHSIIVIAGGFVSLGLCLLAGREFGGGSLSALGGAAMLFIPLWLVAALLNLWVGVSRAGYSVADEAPIAVLVFSVPAAVALFLWWLLTRA